MNQVRRQILHQRRVGRYFRLAGRMPAGPFPGLAPVLVLLAIAACGGEDASPPDTQPPSSVSGFTALAGDGMIKLTWTAPGDPDYFSTWIERSETAPPGEIGMGGFIYNGSLPLWFDQLLVNGTRYHYTAFALDTSGNFSPGSPAAATPQAGDSVPPADVGAFSAVAGTAAGTVQLSWEPPPDGDFFSTRVKYSPNQYPGPGEGVAVFTDFTDRAVLVEGLTSGLNYYFSIFSLDISGNLSAGAQASATPP